MRCTCSILILTAWGFLLGACGSLTGFGDGTRTRRYSEYIEHKDSQDIGHMDSAFMVQFRAAVKEKRIDAIRALLPKLSGEIKEVADLLCGREGGARVPIFIDAVRGWYPDGFKIVKSRNVHLRPRDVGWRAYVSIKACLDSALESEGTPPEVIETLGPMVPRPLDEAKKMFRKGIQYGKVLMVQYALSLGVSINETRMVTYNPSQFWSLGDYGTISARVGILLLRKGIALSTEHEWSMRALKKAVLSDDPFPFTVEILKRPFASKVIEDVYRWTMDLMSTENNATMKELHHFIGALLQSKYRKVLKESMLRQDLAKLRARYKAGCRVHDGPIQACLTAKKGCPEALNRDNCVSIGGAIVFIAAALAKAPGKGGTHAP